MLVTRTKPTSTKLFVCSVPAATVSKTFQLIRTTLNWLSLNLEKEISSLMLVETATYASEALAHQSTLSLPGRLVVS